MSCEKGSITLFVQIKYMKYTVLHILRKYTLRSILLPAVFVVKLIWLSSSLSVHLFQFSYVKWVSDISDFQYAKFQMLDMHLHFELFWSRDIPIVHCRLKKVYKI